MRHDCIILEVHMFAGEMPSFLAKDVHGDRQNAHSEMDASNCSKDGQNSVCV
jgi:hypothetical protein